VVFFLTHYFHTLGSSVPPWRTITKFLVLAKLTPSTAKDKQIATWWSTVIRREHPTEGSEPLAPYQQDQVTLFEHFKAHVWSG
jgi:hypothetical protein